MTTKPRSRKQRERPVPSKLRVIDEADGPDPNAASWGNFIINSASPKFNREKTNEFLERSKIRYELTGNPLLLWEALTLAGARQKIFKEPCPAWLLDALAGMGSQIWALEAEEPDQAMKKVLHVLGFKGPNHYNAFADTKRLQRYQAIADSFFGHTSRGIADKVARDLTRKEFRISASAVETIVLKMKALGYRPQST